MLTDFWLSKQFDLSFILVILTQRNFEKPEVWVFNLWLCTLVQNANKTQYRDCEISMKKNLEIFLKFDSFKFKQG